MNNKDTILTIGHELLNYQYRLVIQFPDDEIFYCNVEKNEFSTMPFPSIIIDDQSLADLSIAIQKYLKDKTDAKNGYDIRSQAT